MEKIMRSFQSALLAAVAAFGIASVASAADMPVKAPIMAPVYNWSGFYVGGNVGYGWSDTEPGTISFYDPAFVGSIAGINYSQKGIIGGAQAGYNYQLNNMVLGLEADFSGTGIKGSVTDTTNNYTSTTHIDWLATVRARAGVVVDRALIYVTGGWAIAGVKTTLDDVYPAGIVTTTSSATHSGWTVGGGVEVALAGNWTVKGEYLYVDLGSKDFNFYEGAAGWQRISGTAALTASIARLGINYRF
jgi:outer membrane immunogenic protein